VDTGRTDSTVAEAGVRIHVVSRPQTGSVQSRRGVIERTNGWINHCRRLTATTRSLSMATKASQCSAKSPYNSDDASTGSWSIA